MIIFSFFEVSPTSRNLTKLAVVKTSLDDWSSCITLWYQLQRWRKLLTKPEQLGGFVCFIKYLVAYESDSETMYIEKIFYFDIAMAVFSAWFMFQTLFCNFTSQKSNLLLSALTRAAAASVLFVLAAGRMKGYGKVNWERSATSELWGMFRTISKCEK